MTPMMEQYFEIKNQYKDYLLFYRIGDFYELFFDDAKLASELLDLTLTGRDWAEEERAPMCGVPFHSVDVYIGKLVSAGYKIAICEQLEDPALAKGLVKRDITRIVTPGTIIEDSLLKEGQNNFIAAVSTENDALGVCFCDISTGQLSATMFSGSGRYDRLLSEFATFIPSEVLCPFSADELDKAGKYLVKQNSTITDNQSERYDYDRCLELVRPHLENPSSLPDEAVILAAGALLSYISDTQKTDLSYIGRLNVYTDKQYLEIDVNTRRNLELVETMRTKEKKGSLLWVLDKTKTSMGARLLRRSVEQPLVNSNDINARLDAVGELADNFMLREELGLQLKNVLDLERLTPRLVYGNANGRDLVAIKTSIAVIPQIRALLADVSCSELCTIRDEMDPLDDLCELIQKAIKPDPPFTIREGGIIEDGYSEEVDKLRAIVRDSEGIIQSLAEREREATGIKTLKIGYNRVFGYYIDVTRSFLSQVPDRYIRKQTLTSSERFITQELKDTESTILGASDRLNSLEYELFKSVVEKLGENLERIQKSASLLARLDFYLSLAQTAHRGNYVRPEVDYGDKILIKDGRHPVVELFMGDSYFVPNDTHLDTGNERLMLITGPNMAGKSTYMRQVALIVLMAQIGSFVPAKEARIGICDKLFTRVGASDDLALGQSTFMLEMSEVAYILKHATRRSLIIYDEIGRGTSTFDGMAIARAIAEYTAKKLRSKTLFATHYHELGELEGTVDGAINYNIAAKKKGDDITFLRKILRGAADDSYGIEVAKLAGVPNEVIRRAKEVLAAILADDTPTKKPARSESESNELTFDNVLESQLADAVRALDVNTLTPLEALNELYRLKKMIE